MNTWVRTLLAAVMLCSTAAAGPMKTERVAGDVKWAVHVNVEAVIRSEVGRFLLNEAGVRQISEAWATG